MSTGRRTTRAFEIYAWGVLLYNVAVILWGAFVRASGSGAGCGEHWPLCNGTVVPQSPTVKTMIEFSHRLTSGLAVALAVGLVIFALRVFPKRHLVRRAAYAVLFFEFMEAAIGAAIVLLGHVAKNPSTARGFSLSAHFINTLLLVAALALAAWGGGAGKRTVRAGMRGWKIAFGVTFAALLILGVSGTIAALGDTLFPAASLREGLRQDFGAGVHPFIRLRIWHPVIAVMVAIGLGALSYTVYARQISRNAVRMAGAVAVLVVAQLGVGVLNLSLLAPVALQMVHLLVADSLWIAFVLMGAEVLRPARVPEQIGETAPPVLAGSRA